MSNVVLDKDSFVRRIKKLYQNWKVNFIISQFSAQFEHFHLILHVYWAKCCSTMTFAIRNLRSIVKLSKFNYLSFVVFAAQIHQHRIRSTVTMIPSKSLTASCLPLARTKKCFIASQPHSRQVIFSHTGPHWISKFSPSLSQFPITSSSNGPFISF
jgi:hypothetical protein